MFVFVCGGVYVFFVFFLFCFFGFDFDLDCGGGGGEMELRVYGEEKRHIIYRFGWEANVAWHRAEIAALVLVCFFSFASVLMLHSLTDIRTLFELRDSLVQG